MGYMNFITQLADKSDAQHTRGNPSDCTFAYPHVRESFSTKIDVMAHSLEDFSRIRASDIHTAPCAGNMGHVYIETPLRVPFEHVLIHALDTTGSRGHVIVILVKTTGDTIVYDHALLVYHGHVP